MFVSSANRSPRQGSDSKRASSLVIKTHNKQNKKKKKKKKKIKKVTRRATTRTPHFPRLPQGTGAQSNRQDLRLRISFAMLIPNIHVPSDVHTLNAFPCLRRPQVRD